MAFTHALSTNNYGEAKFIVSSSAANGTHTTIASALTDAVSGETIFIRAGTYTENLTLKAGVNLTSFDCEAGVVGVNSTTTGGGNVTIVGTCTFTGTGIVNIAGITLKTNGSFFLAVTGTNASVVNLTNCFLNVVDSTGISYTSSNASSAINISYCQGNITAATFALFADSSTGQLNFGYVDIENTLSSTASTVTGGGQLHLNYCLFKFPISLTSSSASLNFTQMNTAATNSTSITTATSGVVNILQSYFQSGSASAVSIGAGTTATMHGCVVDSTNTNAVTGAGSVTYIGTAFAGSSSTTNTTTQVGVGLPKANGTAGQVLTSNGVGAIPTFQNAGANAFASINIQTFTSTGTYTPTAGMLYCIMEVVGGGGGGGATTATTAAHASAAGGGGGGGYARKFATAATVGASQTVTIGAAGAAGAISGGTGGTGGTTSVGTICVATGGTGGQGGTNDAFDTAFLGGAGGAGSTGDILITGGGGGAGSGSVAFAGVGGFGGSSFFGGGIQSTVTSGGGATGPNGSNYGSGGGGGATGGGGNTAAAGGEGAKGVVLITEYI